MPTQADCCGLGHQRPPGNRSKGRAQVSVTSIEATGLAFIGAEGFGAFTTGGRFGDIYHVTSLDDNASNPQPGTLRYGIESRGGLPQRTIVFDVGGPIFIDEELALTSNLTIAGETAPGPGITIMGNPARATTPRSVQGREMRLCFV